MKTLKTSKTSIASQVKSLVTAYIYSLGVPGCGIIIINSVDVEKICLRDTIGYTISIIDGNENLVSGYSYKDSKPNPDDGLFYFHAFKSTEIIKKFTFIDGSELNTISGSKNSREYRTQIEYSTNGNYGSGSSRYNHVGTQFEYVKIVQMPQRVMIIVEHQ